MADQIIRIGTGHDYAASWLRRSTAPGVFAKSNLAACSNKQDMLDSFFTPGFQTGLKELEEEIVLSGKAFRANRPISHGTNEQSPDWRFSFDGGEGAHTKTLSFREFYFQFSFYGDPTWLLHNFGGPGTPKIIILEEPDDSDDKSEIVIQRSSQGRIPIGYRKVTAAGATGPDYVAFRHLWDGFSNANSSTVHNFLNRYPEITTQPTTLAELHDRFGATRLIDPTTPAIQWSPGFFPLGEWCTFTIYVAMDKPAGTTGTVKVWFAPRYGDPPVLLFGTVGNARFDSGSREFTGVQMVNRPENMQIVVPQDTFCLYADAIGSIHEIDSPGFVDDWPLPDPGTDLPPWYPVIGSSDNGA